MINGKKAIKKITGEMNITQTELAAMTDTDRINFNVRINRGYYDKPANLAKLLYQIGGELSLKIDCVATLPNGDKIEMPIDKNFLELDE